MRPGPMQTAACGLWQTFALACEQVREIGAGGARRSEIKGEPRAQPRAEDIRGGGHPPSPAGAMRARAKANDCNEQKVNHRLEGTLPLSCVSRQALWSS